MGFFGKKLFKAKTPDLKSFIGRTVEINGEKIKIDNVQGNVGLTLGRKMPDQRPQFYEINNGTHRISMLRFHAQMEGDKSITEQQFKDFEEMDFYVEKIEDEVKIDAEALKRGEFKIEGIDGSK